MFNAAQQIAGAIGTADLSTIAHTVVVGYLLDHGADDFAQADVQLAGYRTAFISAAAFLVAVAVMTADLVRRPPWRVVDPAVEHR